MNETGLRGEMLIQNVLLPSGLQRAEVTYTSADPRIENWAYLIPEDARMTGAWAFTDGKGVHHLVITWKEYQQGKLIKENLSCQK